MRNILPIELSELNVKKIHVSDLECVYKAPIKTKFFIDVSRNINEVTNICILTYQANRQVNS